MSRYDRHNILVQTVLLCISEMNNCGEGEVHIYGIYSCPVLANRNLSAVSISALPSVICNDKITYLSKYL
jgi:hypothetical protein